MRISDWSSDVCSSDLAAYLVLIGLAGAVARMVGGDYGELAQGLFLCVALGAGGLLFLSARARAWLSVTISKHVLDRKRVVLGKSVSVRLDFGGRRILQKKKQYTFNKYTTTQQT